MSTDTTTTVAKAKLSCNHVQEVGESVKVGDRITCERCTGTGAPRVRRVKKLSDLATVAPAAEVEAAAARIADVIAEVRADGRGEGATDDELAADILQAEADAGLPAEPEPTPEPVATSYDVAKASAEWKALKAWQAGGREGERPDTSNLDAQKAAHAAGNPRPKVGRTTQRTPRVVNPRRAEANTARKAKGFGGRTPVKFTAEELAEYIAKVHEEHPTSSREDELEYAYWVIEMKISRGRWNKAWDAAVGA